MTIDNDGEQAMRGACGLEMASAWSPRLEKTAGKSGSRHGKEKSDVLAPRQAPAARGSLMSGVRAIAGSTRAPAAPGACAASNDMSCR